MAGRGRALEECGALDRIARNLRRPGLALDTVSGREPAHATLNVGGWRGGRAPFDPPACRSDVGASDRGECCRLPNHREPARRGIFLELPDGSLKAGAWPNRWEDTMAGPNKKLVAAAEAYFADLRRVRASGGATAERSYYPALEGLLRAVGATLKPKVFWVQELADQGAGHPDLALYTAPGRFREAIQGRDRFRSVASSRSRALATMRG